MKRQLSIATFGLATLAAGIVFAADKPMSATERVEDMRAKCEIMTGNDRLECLDRVKKQEQKSGAGDRNPVSGVDSTRDQKRQEARTATTDPKQKCDDLTGTDRLACLDQAKKSTN